MKPLYLQRDLIKKKITMEEIDEAIDRVIAGPQKKSRVFSEKESKIVAYHESGHVLAVITVHMPTSFIR